MQIWDVYKNGEFYKRMDVSGKFDALNELHDWGNYSNGDPCGWWAPLNDRERTSALPPGNECDMGAVIDGDIYTAFKLGFTGWPPHESHLCPGYWLGGSKIRDVYKLVVALDDAHLLFDRKLTRDPKYKLYRRPINLPAPTGYSTVTLIHNKPIYDDRGMLKPQYMALHRMME